MSGPIVIRSDTRKRERIGGTGVGIAADLKAPAPQRRELHGVSVRSESAETVSGRASGIKVKVDAVRTQIAKVFSGGASRITVINSGYTTDNFTVTQEILDAKGVELSGEPDDPLKVEFDPAHGIGQRPGVDFMVDGRILAWPSLALEALLEVGDQFTVRYVQRPV